MLYSQFILKEEIVAGASKGQRTDALPGQKTLFRRVQVPEVQAQVDVRQ